MCEHVSVCMWDVSCGRRCVKCSRGGDGVRVNIYTCSHQGINQGTTVGGGVCMQVLTNG